MTIQFIEVTTREYGSIAAEKVIVGTRFIRQVVCNTKDGTATLKLDDGTGIICLESYTQVSAALRREMARIADPPSLAP
jgi:hypothetical protein